jgi:metal-sulfur cluster biosynthetic enzyme
MTLTAPGCGVGPMLVDDVQRKVAGVPGVKDVEVSITFDPPWDQSRMSEAARLQLGLM